MGVKFKHKGKEKELDEAFVKINNKKKIIERIYIGTKNKNKSVWVKKN